MFYQHLRLRSIFIVISTTVIMLLLFKLSFLSSLSVGLTIVVFSILFSFLFRRSIKKSLEDRIATHEEKKDYSKVDLKASNLDNTIYAIDFCLAMTLPAIATYVVFKDNHTPSILQDAIFSNIVWKLLFILCFLWNSVRVFLFRKRDVFLYTLFCLSVALSGAFCFYSSELDIPEPFKNILFFYSSIMTGFIIAVEALFAFDKNEDQNSKRRKHWNNLLNFISRDPKH